MKPGPETAQRQRLLPIRRPLRMRTSRRYPRRGTPSERIAMSQSLTSRQRFQLWVSDNPDEWVLRWIFRSVVTVTIAVLALDLAGMNGFLNSPEIAGAPAEVTRGSPATELPTMVPSVLAPWLPGGDKRLMPVPQAEGVLAKPMTFELVGGGRLMATGTITPGISEAFAAEVGKRSDYIKTVVLNS